MKTYGPQLHTLRLVVSAEIENSVIPAVGEFLSSAKDHLLDFMFFSESFFEIGSKQFVLDLIKFPYLLKAHYLSDVIDLNHENDPLKFSEENNKLKALVNKRRSFVLMATVFKKFRKNLFKRPQITEKIFMALLLDFNQH